MDTMNQITKTVPAHYFYILLGVLAVFIVGFIIFNFIIKRDDFTHEVAGMKKMQEQHQKLREKLTDSERKNDILQNYIAMSEDSRRELMSKLKEIDEDTKH